MIVGDLDQRAKIGSGMKSQNCYRCYPSPDFNDDDIPPCSDPILDTESLPTSPCFGIRTNVQFPT